MESKNTVDLPFSLPEEERILHARAPTPDDNQNDKPVLLTETDSQNTKCTHTHSEKTNASSSNSPNSESEAITPTRYQIWTNKLLNRVHAVKDFTNRENRVHMIQTVFESSPTGSGSISDDSSSFSSNNVNQSYSKSSLFCLTPTKSHSSSRFKKATHAENLELFSRLHNISTVVNAIKIESKWNFLNVFGSAEAQPDFCFTPLDPVNIENIQKYLSSNRRLIEDFYHCKTLTHSINYINQKENNSVDSPHSNTSNSVDSPVITSHQDLQKIPQIYFDETFSLAQTPFFCDSDIESNSLLKCLSQDSAELSAHLDVVDNFLFQKLSSHFMKFLTSLSVVQCITTDCSNSVAQIQILRKFLKFVKNNYKNHGFQILQLSRRSHRLREILRISEEISHVRQSLPSLQLLLASREYDTSINLLTSTKDCLAHSLKGVHATRQISKQLQDLTINIGKILEADFVHASLECLMDTQPLKNEIETQGETFNNDQTNETWSYGWKPIRTYSDFSEIGLEAEVIQELDRESSDLKNCKRLEILVVSLVKEKGLLQGIQSMRNAYINVANKILRDVTDVQINRIMKRKAHQSESDTLNFVNQDGVNSETSENFSNTTDVDKSLSATDVLAKIEHAKFSQLFREILGFAICVVKRLDTWSCLVLRASLESTKITSQYKNAQESQNMQHDNNFDMKKCIHIADDLLSLVEMMSQILFLKCCGLLECRQNANLSLEASEFSQLYWTSVLAMSNLAAIENRLQSRFQFLLKLYYNSETFVDAEPFNEVDEQKKDISISACQLVSAISPNFRAAFYHQSKGILEEFHQNKMMQLNLMMEAEKWERVENLSVALNEAISEMLQGSSKTGISLENISSKRVIFESNVYHLIASGLGCIRSITEYVQLHRVLPLIGPDVIQCLNLFIKSFAQHAIRLVVQGEAIQKGAIKKITVTNLSLCSQVLDFISASISKLTMSILSIFLSSSQLVAFNLNYVESADSDSQSDEDYKNDSATDYVNDICEVQSKLTNEADGTHVEHKNECDLDLESSTSLTSNLMASDAHPSTQLRAGLKIPDEAFTGVVASQMGIRLSIKPTPFVAELRNSKAFLLKSRNQVLQKIENFLLERYDGCAQKWLSTSHSQASYDDEMNDMNKLELYTHSAMKSIVKDLSSFFKVLQKNLPDTQVTHIFQRAFHEIANHFEYRVGSSIRGINTATSDGTSNSPHNLDRVSPVGVQESVDVSSLMLNAFVLNYPLKPANQALYDQNLKSYPQIGNRYVIDCAFLFMQLRNIPIILKSLTDLCCDIINTCIRMWTIDTSLVKLIENATNLSIT